MTDCNNFKTKKKYEDDGNVKKWSVLSSRTIQTITSFNY